MAENNFRNTVDALVQGIDTVISTETVVGDPIHIGDTITKLLDMVPDLIDRFKKDKKMTEKEVSELLDEAEKEKK